MKTIDKNCQTCGLVFQASLKEIKRGNGKYCSRKCVLTKGNKTTVENHAKKLISINCGWCKKEIKVKPSRLKNNKKGLNYCSRQCKEAGQGVDGLPGMQPSHYKGHSAYREYALSKLKNECNRCGFHKNVNILQVHHVDENRENNKLENLEILCPNCHAEEHWGHSDNGSTLPLQGKS